MGEMNFNTFLSRMGKETNPSLEEDKPKRVREPVEEEENIAPEEIYEREDRSRREERPRREESRREEPKREEKRRVVVEDYEDEPEQLTEEEIVEKAFEYAKSVIKVVRTNFNSDRERKIFFEAVKSAVSLCLGESQQQQSPRQQIVAPQILATKGKKTKKNEPAIQAEQEVTGYELDGMDITEQIRKSTQAPLKLEDVEDFNIKRKVNSRGEVEADISGMTADDMKAFKVLAGVQNG
jgi:hypothetical protein